MSWTNLHIEYKCPYCGKSDFHNNGGFSSHVKTCSKNPDREKNLKNKKKREEPEHSIEELTCQYCGRIFKRIGDRKQHEDVCPKNPNKICRTKHQKEYEKYNSLSDEELLNEINKYNFRKETPHILVRVCKDRKVYDFKNNIYGKEHIYTDDELIKELDKYTCKKEIPGTLRRELKRRKIELPKRFSINPRAKYNIDIKLLSTDDLLNKLKNINDSFEAHEHGLDNIINELKHRGELPEKFKISRVRRKEHYMSDEELIHQIESYNTLSECNNAGYGPAVTELRNRNKLPERFHTGKYRKEHYMSDEELIEQIKQYRSKQEASNNGKGKILLELKKRNIEYNFINGRKYHPEYQEMTNEELINIGKIEFKNCINIKKGNKKNRSLINILREKNLLHIIFPNSYVLDNNGNKICAYNSKDFSIYQNKQKLSLLTKYDLEGMDWSVIIDLIGEDKLPKDFYCLCKFGPNTEGRKEQIKKLKEIYNIETEEEEEVENNTDEVIENEVSDIDNYIYNENEDEIFEDELKPYKDIEDIGSLINLTDEEIYSTGDKYQHIFSKEMSKLWGLILRDDENHSTKNIDIIKVKVNDNSITSFSKHIYEEFLKEYEEVINIQIN